MIQVDFQQDKNPIVAEWHAFWTCYGCLRLIIGSIIRDNGLHLRQKPDHKVNGMVVGIKCLEDAVHDGTLSKGKKWTEVFLTINPSELLRFLGMLQGGEKWNELAFASVGDFAYFICSKNRFFDIGKTERYQQDYEDEITRYRDSEKYYQFFKFWAMEYLPENKAMLKSSELAHLSRVEIEEEVANFFSGARDEIIDKIRIGRSEYEPKRFWKTLELRLRTAVEPEVVRKYDSEHPMQYWLHTVKLCGKHLLRPFLICTGESFPELTVHGSFSCLAEASDRLPKEVQAKLSGFVNDRISRVTRRIKEDMAYYTADDAKSKFSRPPELETWTAAKYDQLLQSCVDNRLQLEEEQRVIDKVNFEAHKRRKEYKALQQQTK